MNNVAIITARGGSKRIPRKNIRPFLGKPIIAYVIQAARQSGLFQEVMVSTDDTEIADVARHYGASVPFMRSAENADDFATTTDALLEVIADYERLGKTFDVGCCLYPTTPFVTAALLRQAFDVLTTQAFDTVYPVQAFGFPVQRAVALDASGRVRWLQPEHQQTRSQDLENAYHDTGQFYVFKTAALLKSRQLISANAGGIVISEMQAHDIDTEDDWQVAEFKWQLMNQQP
jgi:pseudaminic acid cytidylyltransferase